MNTKPINDGGSAFPFGQISELTGQPINGFFEPGMTLRDWFAGMAMQGILSYQGLGVRFNQTASDAFDMADTMIAEREKGGSHE